MSRIDRIISEATAAKAEIAELERVRDLLIAIVQAKRNGHPEPRAWAEAFAYVDDLIASTEAAPRGDNLRCPDCRAILANPPETMLGDDAETLIDVPAEPLAIECGREHVYRYAEFVITTRANVWTLERIAPPAMISVGGGG